MSLVVIRSALRPQTALRRTLFLSLLGVVAIVVGLLAMHTLSVDSPGHTTVAITPMDHHHPAELSGPEGPQSTSDDCDSEGCHPVHAMGLMTCVLALLAVTLLFGAGSGARRWIVALPSVARSLAWTLRAASPTPPSLIYLSISRT